MQALASRSSFSKVRCMVQVTQLETSHRTKRRHITCYQICQESTNPPKQHTTEVLKVASGTLHDTCKFTLTHYAVTLRLT